MSTMATDALVLKHGDIGIHSVDVIFIVSDHILTKIYLTCSEQWYKS